MLKWLKTRREDRCKAKELYGLIVTGARQPAFYAECGVQDTPEGRFEMVALHLFLVLERLRSSDGAEDRLSRYLLEAFVTDMDDCMREMGVGDLSVGKKVKRSAAVAFARFAAYREAFSDPVALAGVLSKAMPGCDAARLARYAMASQKVLEGNDVADIRAGAVSFAGAI